MAPSRVQVARRLDEDRRGIRGRLLTCRRGGQCCERDECHAEDADVRPNP